MTLAKAVVTGTIFRNPEKRFTQNNVAVSAFVLNIGEREESLLRIIAKRQSLDEVVSTCNKGDKVIVEGRLQTANVKMDDGTDRKIYEIEASTIEKMGSDDFTQTSEKEDIVKFADESNTDELIGEDEIPF